MTLLSQLLDLKGHGVHAVTPGSSVIDAIRSMADNHVGALLVLEDGKLAGIVSERDYARKVILHGKASSTTAVREIMTTPVITAGPMDTVDHAMRIMTERRIRHLPVITEGRLDGVVSIGDLVKAVMEVQQLEIDALQAYIHG